MIIIRKGYGPQAGVSRCGGVSDGASVDWGIWEGLEGELEHKSGTCTRNGGSHWICHPLPAHQNRNTGERCQK